MAKQLSISMNSKSGSKAARPDTLQPAVDETSVGTAFLELPSVVVSENEVVNAPTVTVVMLVPSGLPGLCAIICNRSPF